MNEEVGVENERWMEKEYEEIDRIIDKYKLYYHVLEHEMYDIIMRESEARSNFYFGAMIKAVDVLMYEITDISREELTGDIFILYENAYLGSRYRN